MSVSTTTTDQTKHRFVIPAASSACSAPSTGEPSTTRSSVASLYHRPSSHGQSQFPHRSSTTVSVVPNNRRRGERTSIAKMRRYKSTSHCMLETQRAIRLGDPRTTGIHNTHKQHISNQQLVDNSTKENRYIKSIQRRTTNAPAGNRPCHGRDGRSHLTHREEHGR